MPSNQLKYLSELICQLRVAYEVFLKLSEQQRKDVVNNDLEGLNQTNLKIDEALQNTQELEQQRLLMMGHLEVQGRRSFANATEVHEHFRTDESESFLAEVKLLKEVLSKVTKSNQVNQTLIRSSREFIRSNMAILTGYSNHSARNKFKTYGDRGHSFSQPVQERRLLNKEV